MIKVRLKSFKFQKYINGLSNLINIFSNKKKLFIYIFIMSAPNPITQKGLVQNLNNVLFTIKDINKINEIFKLEISFEDIQKKNLTFRIYKTIEEFINSFEQFILNNNISIKENNNGLILDLYIFNIMNGNKEKVTFEFNKIENTNKDEIIKSLCLKMNDLEEKYNKLNEKYNIMEKNYEKIMSIVGPMIKAKEEDIKKGIFRFQWENHDNCELSNNNKKLKKIKNNGWNTNVKGNKILRKNSINIFKIRVNNNNSDKSGLCFGIARDSTNFSSCPFNEEWNIRCDSITSNSKFKSFKSSQINKDDIITFIVDLSNGTLEVKKNDESLGKLNDIPKNEDLVPCVCNYYVGNEIEIIE